MSTPTSDAGRGALLAAGLLLAACSPQAPKQDAQGNLTAAASAGAERIACAVDGAAMAADGCTVEHDGDDVLIVGHPDGGFRRLRLIDDGYGVAAADGALPARVAVAGDGAIEVTIGADRYRLPATIRSRAGTS